MCLESATTKTNLFRLSDEITVYKVLDNKLKSPYYYFQYKEGENTVEEDIEWVRENVHGGALHVMLEYSDAWYIADRLIYMREDSWIVVKMRAKKEDFIAEGYFNGSRSACFRKLYYYEKDQQNA